jgi:hypothetical protein
MVIQERTSWNSENDDDSDSPAYSGQRSERSSSSFEPSPRAEKQQASVARASLEGMIWQQKETQWPKPEKANKPDRKEDDDDDEDEDEDRPRPVAAPADKKAEQSDEQDTTKDESESDDVADSIEQILTEVQEAAAEDDDEALEEDGDNNDRPIASRAIPLSQPQRPAPAAPPTPSMGPRPVVYPAFQPTVEYRQPAPVIREAEQGPADAPLEAADIHTTTQAQPEREPTYQQSIPSQEAASPAPLEGAPEQPPLPPIGPPAEHVGYASPPERPVPPIGYAPNVYPAPPVAEQAGLHAAPASRVEQAPANSHRHGEPLAAAVGVGLVAEHFWNRGKHKKHEKQIEQVTQQGMQQHEQAAAHSLHMQEQQRRFAAEQQRQVAEMQRMRTVQEQFTAASPYALENAPSSQQPVQRFEAPAGVQAPMPRTEQQPAQRPEHMPPIAPQNSEQQPDQMMVESATAFPPDQHVERSAWHNIVVDKHGHEVSGAMHYGQEFYRQREHEMLQDRTTANPGTPGVSTGGSGIAPAGQPAGYPTYQPSYHQDQGTLPSGMTSPALPPGQPTHADPQHQLPEETRKQVTSNMGNPWFWLMLGLVVAAFFTAALI